MSRDDVRRSLVAYDVADDNRRTRLAKVLLGFGDRVQYSVFVVDITPAQMIRLRAKMIAEVNLTTDSILVCDLGRLSTISNSRFEFLGRWRQVTGSDSFVL